MYKRTNATTVHLTIHMIKLIDNKHTESTTIRHPPTWIFHLVTHHPTPPRQTTTILFVSVSYPAFCLSTQKLHTKAARTRVKRERERERERELKEQRKE